MSSRCRKEGGCAGDISARTTAVRGRQDQGLVGLLLVVGGSAGQQCTGGLRADRGGLDGKMAIGAYAKDVTSAQPGHAGEHGEQQEDGRMTPHLTL